MKFPACGLATVLLYLSINAAVAQTAAVQEPRSNVASYRCEDGVKIQAAYVNLQNESLAVLYYNGQLIPMHQAVSGSGVLYVADDEQNSYRWHSKGKMGVLSFLAADHTAKEKIILRNCKQIEPK